MKELFTNERLKPGVKFKGNVNNEVFEIIKIERPQHYIYSSSKCCNVVVKDKKGNTFCYGLEALKRCSITILE